MKYIYDDPFAPLLRDDEDQPPVGLVAGSFSVKIEALNVALQHAVDERVCSTQRLMLARVELRGAD